MTEIGTPSVSIDPSDQSKSTWQWFLIFTIWIITMVTSCIYIATKSSLHLDFTSVQAVKETIDNADPLLKLLIVAGYMSIACTFTPFLNTSIVVSAAAIVPGITGELFTTVLILSIFAAAGSTIANMNDYHIFTLMLKSKKIERIKNTNTYIRAEKWFAKYPFGILFLFNIAPLSVDVSRPLAAAYKYPRRLFAISNFLGRFSRYAVITTLTFLLGEKLGLIAPVSLIAVAVLMILAKIIFKKLRPAYKAEIRSQT